MQFCNIIFLRKIKTIACSNSEGFCKIGRNEKKRIW